MVGVHAELRLTTLQPEKELGAFRYVATMRCRHNIPHSQENIVIVFTSRAAHSLSVIYICIICDCFMILAMFSEDIHHPNSMIFHDTASNEVSPAMLNQLMALSVVFKPILVPPDPERKTMTHHQTMVKTCKNHHILP